MRSIFGNRNVIKNQTKAASAESNPLLNRGIKTGEMKVLMGFYQVVGKQEHNGSLESKIWSMKTENES